MRRLAFVAALVFAGSVLPAAADMIVVAASGDTKVAPGSEITASTALSLPEGARITVLSKDGTMQVIDGPFDGTLGKTEKAPANESEDWAAVKSFLGDPDARSNVLGASRSVDAELPVPPSIWHVSVDSSGPRCIRSQELVLSRKDATSNAVVSVRSAAGRLTDVAWKAGETGLRLPDEFADDGRMVVRLGEDMRELYIIKRPDDLTGAAPGVMLGWLIDESCKRQAAALISHVHQGVALD